MNPTSVRHADCAKAMTENASAILTDASCVLTGCGDRTCVLRVDNELSCKDLEEIDYHTVILSNNLVAHHSAVDQAGDGVDHQLIEKGAGVNTEVTQRAAIDTDFAANPQVGHVPLATTLKFAGTVNALNRRQQPKRFGVGAWVKLPGPHHCSWQRTPWPSGSNLDILGRQLQSQLGRALGLPDRCLYTIGPRSERRQLGQPATRPLASGQPQSPLGNRRRPKKPEDVVPQALTYRQHLAANSTTICECFTGITESVVTEN